MDEFLKKLAEILDAGEVKESDDIRSFPQWDSLSVLSVIAMADAGYGVNLRAADLQEAASAGALWKLVQSKTTV